MAAPQSPSPATSKNRRQIEDLVSDEVAHVLHVLSMQSNPIKEDTPKLVGTVTASSSSSSSSSSSGATIEIQRLEWRRESRTMVLAAYPEVGLYASSSSSAAATPATSLLRPQQLLLAPPLQLELYFPESSADPPLCFGSTDAAALVAERVNASILPLDRTSLLVAVCKITAIIKQEIDAIWPAHDVDYRAQFGAALVAHLTQHVTSADLLLSLLFMSKAHNPTIKFPVPKFFYLREGSSSLLIDQPALALAIAAIPPLQALVEGDDGVTRAANLPFASCVLLHHLFFRERVALVDGRMRLPPRPPGSTALSSSSPPRGGDEEGVGEEDEVERLLRHAGLDGATGDERPSMVFPLRHAADARFLALAAQYGTCSGFHGSPPTNFFSIVALGLRSLSNTKAMKNGAVFGDGVYLASRCEVARNFGAWGVPVWRHSRFGVTPAASSSASASAPVFAYQIIALCEFINKPEYRCTDVAGSSPSPPPAKKRGSRGGGGKPGSSSSEYYVVAEDEHLVVRALLLFKDPATQRGPPTPSFLGAAGASGGGPHPPSAHRNLPAPLPLNHPAARGHKWQMLVSVVRGVFFLVALVMLLSTVEKLAGPRQPWRGRGRRGF